MIKALLVCLIIPFLFGAGFAAIEDQQTLARGIAREAGIDTVESIQREITLPGGNEYLAVRGDEILNEGKGQYKELFIPLDGDRLVPNQDYHVVDFVEIESGEGMKRIQLLGGIDVDTAYTVLSRFYKQKPSYDPSPGAVAHPVEACADDALLSFTYESGKDCYRIFRCGNFYIDFKIMGEQIVITEYGVLMY